MELYQNFVSDSELEFLRFSFDQWYSTGVFRRAYTVNNPDVIQEVYKSQEKDLTQQERTNIGNNSKLSGFIRNLLSPLIKIKPHNEIWFCRSVYPIGIHSDTPPVQGHTIIIPLTFDERIKTIVFDVKMTNEEFAEYSKNFAADPGQFQKKHNLSSEYNLQNCWFGDPCIVDYFDIAGMAGWHKGCVMKFERSRLHASTNYRDIVNLKDYILIHTDE